jgi:hypothetical protein
MIIRINEAELRKNTAHGAIAATIKPPIVGPTARPMLLSTALRARAEGSSDLETSALMVGIIGVLIIVVPAPRANVSINNKEGVITPRRCYYYYHLTMALVIDCSLHDDVLEYTIKWNSCKFHDASISPFNWPHITYIIFVKKK